MPVKTFSLSLSLTPNVIIIELAHPIEHTMSLLTIAYQLGTPMSLLTIAQVYLPSYTHTNSINCNIYLPSTLSLLTIAQVYLPSYTYTNSIYHNIYLPKHRHTISIDYCRCLRRYRHFFSHTLFPNQDFICKRH